MSAKYTHTVQQQNLPHEEKFKRKLEQALTESKNKAPIFFPFAPDNLHAKLNGLMHAILFSEAHTSKNLQ